ncbi:MAG: hypothetical protein ACXVP0_09065, partial [Bacteroidia bacterium]
ISDIVLVFTETNPSAIEGREEANRERWENLLKTYPEFFQFETNYKTLCQCNTNGDTAAFKKAQGFYVYVKGKEEPKTEPVKTETKKAEKEVADAGRSKGKAKEEPEKPKKEEKVKKEKAPKEEKPAKEVAAKKEEKPAEEADDAPPAAPAKVSKPGKAGYAKPKKAKDPKACGIPCYEGGDEDLFAFFRDNIPLSKKQRRHSGDLEAVLKLQLNFDGSIKKTFVTGANPDFNKMVEDAAKKMNNWNPAVKGGITIKSEVKMTLKYDSGTKAIKPFETAIIPRPGPKCTCMTESELVD